MNLKQAAQQALEALQTPIHEQAFMQRQSAINNLRAALAQQAESAVWLRVIDEALTVHHIGVADPADDYATAKRKMDSLLCVAQDIGAYFVTDVTVAEPVAKVELMKTGGNAGLATRIVEIDNPLWERLRPGQILYRVVERAHGIGE